MYEKRISDRIEGIFPPASHAGFNVDDSDIQHQAIGVLDQKYLLAHTGRTHAMRTYTRIPPLRLLDQLDPRLAAPAAQSVKGKTKAVAASLTAHHTRAGTLGIPTGLLLLFMLLLSQTLPEMPHHAPYKPPNNPRAQHSPSIQISTASSQTSPDQSSGSQPSGSSNAPQASSPSAPAIQTASPVTPATPEPTAPNVTVAGGKGGGPGSTPTQPSAQSTTPSNPVNQTPPTVTVAVPPVSVPLQTKPIISTNGTSLTLN